MILGFDVSASLDTKHHKMRLIKDLRAISRTLRTYDLSLDRKLMILKTLLIPKIFTTPLGIYDLASIRDIQRAVNAAAKLALGTAHVRPTRVRTYQTYYT
jgi:hypothetical protein